MLSVYQRTAAEPVQLECRRLEWIVGRRGRNMASGREEAAPTFPTWKARLEQADSSRLPEIVARFVDVLRAVGTPMIDGPEVHFVYCSPGAHQVMLEGEFN